MQGQTVGFDGSAAPEAGAPAAARGREAAHASTTVRGHVRVLLATQASPSTLVCHPASWPMARSILQRRASAGSGRASPEHAATASPMNCVRLSMTLAAGAERLLNAR